MMCFPILVLEKQRPRLLGFFRKEYYVLLQKYLVQTMHNLVTNFPFQVPNF